MNKVTCETLLEEVLAMLDVCFEGDVEQSENGISLTLTSGERFLLRVRAV